jgi:hypothetical protein
MRALVNAGITLSKKVGKYLVRLIGQNLTNTVYRSSAQDVTGLWRFALYGRSRFFALQAGLKLGSWRKARNHKA